MNLKEAYERIEWQIKHDVNNYDKDPTIAGIMDLERIKQALDELQAYKDKEDKLRKYIKVCDYIDRECENERVLQILNEGGK